MDYGILRIETNNSLTVKHWQIYLGDTEITNYVRNIKIEADARRQIPVITLEIISKLRIPDAIQAQLTVYQDELPKKEETHA